MDKKNKSDPVVEGVETIIIGNIPLSTKNTVSDLTDILYTPEEILLLHEGVTVHELNTLKQLFGKKYILPDCESIVNRLKQYNALLREIESHDNKVNRDPYKTIVTTGGFLDEPYNRQRKRESKNLIPHHQKVDDGILIDLFSRGMIDILSLKLIDDDLDGRNKDLIEKYGDGYLFNPKSMIYVDLFNKNGNRKHARGIDEIYIKNDSLRFIAMLPDDTANYIVSGFDDYIIKSYMPLGARYLDYLTTEIYRTTKKGGIITGINFEKMNLLEEKGFKDIAISEEDDDDAEKLLSFSKIYCYGKKE